MDAGAADLAGESADPAAPTEANLEEDAGATDLAMGSADPAAPTEANLEAEVLSMTAEAIASTEADAAAVGPVTRVDSAAPTEPDPEAPISPNAESEIARGSRLVIETPELGLSPRGLEGEDETPATHMSISFAIQSADCSSDVLTTPHREGEGQGGGLIRIPDLLCPLS
ncbi:MAG: hypothetical protein JO034_10450 [Singulisphaera sp.]|nr:hypothetical protein [Singulisphaera sp.]